MTTNNETSTTAAKPSRARRGKTADADTAPAPAAPPPASASPTKTTSKSDTVIKLLLRAKGATPLELIAATDWQPHSLRAFLSGLRKKGRIIVREERKGGGFAYRIVPAATAVADGSDAASKVATEAAADLASADDAASTAADDTTTTGDA